MKTLILIITVALSFNLTSAPTENQEGITGTWLVQDGSAKVHVEKAGGKYHGKIVWLKNPLNRNGQPERDLRNPDKALQSRPVLGLPLLSNFVQGSNNVWEDGKIYDPESGSTYSCKITLKNPQLMEVRGYVGFSLLGRTEKWTRVPEVK